MSIRKRLLEGFLFIISGRAGAGLLTLLITPIIVRVLGSGGYGDYAFALAVYSTLRTVSGGGIYEGLRKYIAETTDPEHRSEVFQYYLNVAIVFGSVVGTTLVAVTYLFVGTVVLDARLRPYLYLVGVLVFLHPFFYVVRSALMGHELERYSEPLVVLDKFFLGIIGLPLAYIGFHVVGMLVGHVLALVIIVVVGSIAIHRHTEVSLEATGVFLDRFGAIYESPMFRYSMLTILFVSLTKSLYTVDIILLQPIAGSREVAYYQASLIVAEFLWFVPYAIQIALLHSTSKLWAEGRVNEIDDVASNVVRYTLLLSGLLAILLVVTGEVFLPLYFGPEFSISYVPMLLLLPGALCFAVARPIYAIGQGHGNMRILVISTGTAAAVNLVLNLLLIPPFGMYGAAVATSVGYGTMVFLHNWAANKIGFHPLQNIRFLRIAASCGVALPVLFVLGSVLPGVVLPLVVLPPVGFGLFTALVLVSGALELQELRRLRGQGTGP